jgi:hypothetical protein
LRTFAKIYGRNWRRRDWLVFFTILLIGVAVLAMRQITRAADDITSTISKAEPTMMQDGTPAHPFADADQCPPKTDMIFWPSGRSVPSIPPGLSVCFVGNEPFESSGPDRVEVHER